MITSGFIVTVCNKLIDIGIKAGIHGGNLVATGKYKDIVKNKNSLTALYLSKKKNIPVPKKRRKYNKNN